MTIFFGGINLIPFSWLSILIKHFKETQGNQCFRKALKEVLHLKQKCVPLLLGIYLRIGKIVHHCLFLDYSILCKNKRLMLAG
jgi:hypothetical protein